MGTKNEPGRFDCHAKARPDEPLFTLLARDHRAPQLVELWALMAERDGENPAQVKEAHDCAAAMRRWWLDHVDQGFNPLGCGPEPVMPRRMTR